MKKEKIIILFIAIFIGLIFALVGFFIYQQSKSITPNEIKDISIEKPKPSPEPSIFITIDRPNDEQVVDKRTIAVSGKTNPNAKIVILTPTSEEAGIAAKDGSFSTDIILDEGENIIEISAIAENGEIAKIRRTVIYSTEDF